MKEGGIGNFITTLPSVPHGIGFPKVFGSSSSIPTT